MERMGFDFGSETEFVVTGPFAVFDLERYHLIY